MKHPFDRPRRPTPSKPARYAILERIERGAARAPIHLLRRRPQPSFGSGLRRLLGAANSQ